MASKPVLTIIYNVDGKAAKEVAASWRLEAKVDTVILNEVVLGVYEADIGQYLMLMPDVVDAKSVAQKFPGIQMVDYKANPAKFEFPTSEIERVFDTPKKDPDTVNIPLKWQKLPWNELRELAQNFSEDVIGTKREAIEAIEAELVRRN